MAMYSKASGTIKGSFALHRGPKIGASIKLASQRDGQDLDPQGTKFQPRSEGGPPGQGMRRPVGSQAGQAAGQDMAGRQACARAVYKLVMIGMWPLHGVCLFSVAHQLTACLLACSDVASCLERKQQQLVERQGMLP